MKWSDSLTFYKANRIAFCDIPRENTRQQYTTTILFGIIPKLPSSGSLEIHPMYKNTNHSLEQSPPVVDPNVKIVMLFLNE